MNRRAGLFVALGLALSFAVAMLLGPFASDAPDGLERVAIDKGFDEAAEDHAFTDSPVADYSLRGVPNEKLSVGLSGAIGVVATFGLAMATFAFLRASRSKGRDTTSKG